MVTFAAIYIAAVASVCAAPASTSRRAFRWLALASLIVAGLVQ